MEILRRFGGSAGALIAIAGAGVVYFAPDHRVWGWSVLAAGALLSAAAAWLNQEDLVNLMKGRPFRHGANALFYSLLVLGIVGAADFIAARHNKRFDLTEQGLHSLSPQTVKILKALDQDVTVAAFYSPTQGGRQQTIDQLEEYKYHSPRVTVRVIDPDRSPGEAKAYGIEEYGTIVVSCKAGEARVTTGLSGALTEEQLTNALIKATAKEKKILCVVTGHGERRIDEAGREGFQQAAEALRKENFEVREARLLEGDAPLSGCSSVIVPGPKHALLDPEVERIEGYLKEGGSVLVLREPRTPTGLEPLLERYGLKAGNDFIVDLNPMSRLVGGSPAAPVIYDYGTHPIVKDLEGVVTLFPTVGSVETTTPVEPGVTTETLARTSEKSWGEMGDLADAVSLDPTEKTGPLDIAAAAVKKSAPPAPDPNAAEGEKPDEGGAPRKETRIVLFGDADHATNSAFTIGGNKDLFMNTIAWLNERTDLISIRPKSRTSQPLSLTAQQARALLLYALGFCPVAMLTLGVGVYLRRRRL